MPSQPHGGRATVESSIRRSAATTPSGVPRLSRSREDYLKAMFALVNRETKSAVQGGDCGTGLGASG